VVPVYNSQQSLHTLVERLEPVLESCAGVYELILVNDGSRDDSWAKLSALAESHAWITGINLMRNFGQHNALLCGIRATQYPIVVTIDDDLQHPPEEIPKLLDKLDEGFDVVYGKPDQRQQGFMRDFATFLIKLSMKAAMGVQKAAEVSPFRAFRGSLKNAFAGYQSPYVNIDVLLSWGATRYAAVPFHHAARQVGVSNYSFGKLIGYSINMATSFSAVPLRFASIVGLGVGMFGAFTLVVVLVRTAYGGDAPAGFPFLASIVAVFSGAQLLALGIMGEYLARLHFRSMERPTYVVSEVRGEQSGESSLPQSVGFRQTEEV